MFERKNDTSAQIKAFHRNDWIWIDIEFKKQDLYKRDVWGWKENNPKLVKVGKKYFLNFSYQSKTKLSNAKLKEQKICSVDLGINNSAVCSVMDAKGTVLARKFVNQPTEKDRLYTMTNKLRKTQSVSGWISAPNFWRRIKGLQTHIIHHTSHEIVRFANENDCDVIVFEYLDKMKVPKGFWGAKKLRFKLRYWRKTAIQKKIEEMAHYIGMRILESIHEIPVLWLLMALEKWNEIIKKTLPNLQRAKSIMRIYQLLIISELVILFELSKNPFRKTKWLALQAKVPELSKKNATNLVFINYKSKQGTRDTEGGLIARFCTVFKISRCSVHNL